MLKVSKGSIDRAKRVLREAPAETVAAVERGELRVSTADAELRQVRPARREPERTAAAWSRPVRRNAQRHWTELREALDRLTGLPAPGDVVAHVHPSARADLERRVGVAALVCEQRLHIGRINLSPALRDEQT